MLPRAPHSHTHTHACTPFHAQSKMALERIVIKKGVFKEVVDDQVGAWGQAGWATSSHRALIRPQLSLLAPLLAFRPSTRRPTGAPRSLLADCPSPSSAPHQMATSPSSNLNPHCLSCPRPPPEYTGQEEHLALRWRAAGSTQVGGQLGRCTSERRGGRAGLWGWGAGGCGGLAFWGRRSEGGEAKRGGN